MTAHGHLPTRDPSIHSPYARALHWAEWGLALSCIIHLPSPSFCLLLFLFISQSHSHHFHYQLGLDIFFPEDSNSVDPESGPKQWIAKGTFRIRLLTAQLQTRTLRPSVMESSQQKVVPIHWTFTSGDPGECSDAGDFSGQCINSGISGWTIHPQDNGTRTMELAGYYCRMYRGDEKLKPLILKLSMWDKRQLPKRCISHN